MILEVDHVSKRFGKTLAVNDVSLAVPEGEICGLLGPNGAGKTTLIRMIMDILKPDSGKIGLAVGGGDKRKSHIGYLPEERGLYAQTRVRETLIYFARLKGLSHAQATLNTDHFLKRLEMTPTARQKIGKLSKGNQQKIQFISAVVAKPRLLILDEPFSGLDPVNVQMVSHEIKSLRDEGVTILLSTHQMNQAETFCQRIFLFNQGQLILEGPLAPIIETYSGKYLVVESEAPLPAESWFEVLQVQGKQNKIALGEDKGLRDLLRWCADQPFEVHAIRPFRVPLSEIFIKEVKKHG